MPTASPELPLSRPTRASQRVLPLAPLALLIAFALSCGSDSEARPGVVAAPDQSPDAPRTWDTMRASPAWDNVHEGYLACLEEKGYRFLGASEADGVVLLDGSIYKPAEGAGFVVEGAHLQLLNDSDKCSASSGLTALRAEYGLVDEDPSLAEVRAANERAVAIAGCLEEHRWPVELVEHRGLLVIDPPYKGEERSAFDLERARCAAELVGPGGPANP